MPYCAAFGCQNGTYGKYVKEGVSFHRFPMSRQDLLKQWTHNIRRKDWKPTPSSRLCSEHFSLDCYEMDMYQHIMGETLAGKHYKRLKPGAVPTIFDHCDQGHRKGTGRKHSMNRIKNKEEKEVYHVLLCNHYIMYIA